MLLAKHNELKGVYKNVFFRRLNRGEIILQRSKIVVEVPLGVLRREYKARYRHMVLWKSERIFMPGNTLHL